MKTKDIGMDKMRECFNMFKILFMSRNTTGNFEFVIWTKFVILVFTNL